jgi:hypothetical protein
MKINYDIDVICPSCGEKAQFFFPFRRIYAMHIDRVRKSYPQASFEPFETFSLWGRYEKFIVVNEFFDQKSIGSNIPAWLMNIDPKLFDCDKLPKRTTGLIKCTSCGLVKKSTLSQESYYYKVAVGKRYLVAKKKPNLIFLRDAFASNIKLTNDPNEDMPAIFYSKRKEIVEKIDKLLQRE